MVTTWQWSFHLISITAPVERACEFLLLIFHCSTKWNDFKLQTSLIWKKEKIASCGKCLLGVALQKSFHKSFTKFTKKYLCYSLFLILLRPSVRQACNFIEKRPRTGVSESAICRSSTKCVFLNNSQNSQENTYVGSLVLNKVKK